MFITGKKEFQTSVKVVLCYSKQGFHFMLSLSGPTIRLGETRVSVSATVILSPKYIYVQNEKEKRCVLNNGVKFRVRIRYLQCGLEVLKSVCKPLTGPSLFAQTSGVRRC